MYNKNMKVSKESYNYILSLFNESLDDIKEYASKIKDGQKYHERIVHN